MNNTILYAAPTNTTFVDVFTVGATEPYSDSAAKFVAEYKDSGLYASNNHISDTAASTLYYLLYARYGNDVLNSTDIMRFKYALWSIIYAYGPAWEERICLQSKIRRLTDEELVSGSKAIHNHAFNNGAAPSTAELAAINEQNTTSYTKSRIEALGLKWEMVSTDVTNEFLTKFARLFRIVIAPTNQLVFEVNDDEN